MEGVSLLEILIWVHYKGIWIINIRTEIIYGRGKFVGDFNMGNIRGKICADNVTHIKISDKLTPSINYFLNRWEG